MARTGGMAQAAGGRLGTAVAVLAGLLAAALMAPLPEPDGRAGAGPRDREPTGTTTAVLTVPEGEVSSTLTVVDAAGRELATLTRWYNGEIAGVIPRGDGTALGFWLGLRGGASVEWTGTVRRTSIRMNADGTAETAATRRVGVPAGLEPAPGAR
jgi:hypothetical protein